MDYKHKKKKTDNDLLKRKEGGKESEVVGREKERIRYSVSVLRGATERRKTTEEQAAVYISCDCDYEGKKEEERKKIKKANVNVLAVFRKPDWTCRCD